MDFLKIDSPFMRFLETVANLMILNVLVIVCSLPLVTAGASFTAMHYVLLKIARKEEGYIVKSFFHSFKQNFLQATLIWLIMLAVAAALFFDWRFIRSYEMPTVYVVLLYGVALVAYLIFLYVFPVLSHYSNTIAGTFRSAFTMSVLGFITLRTILMGIVWPLVFVALWFAGYTVVPLVLVFCFTGPGFLRAKLYSGIFEVYEKKAQSASEEQAEEKEKE
ncbi:MAG: YesL family protein [Lachnospiraceae bacterium]|nr:YesL family protein [Lachnospiraceae bacterium]